MSVKDSENSPLLPPTSPETALENADEPENDEEEVVNDHKNKRNPFLIIIISLLIILLIMMGIVIGLLFFGQNNMKNMEEKIDTAAMAAAANYGKRQGICETNECATLSHQLMNWRDQRIDPCEDFYEATCGRYLEHTSTEGTRLIEKENIVRRLIKTQLHKNITTFSKSENALKTLYNKCEGMKDLEKGPTREAQMYREVLRDIGGVTQWPILNPNWTDSGVNLNEILLRMSKIGLRNFGIFEVIPVGYVSNGSRTHLLVRPESKKKIKGDVLPEELKVTIRKILDKNEIPYSERVFEKDFEDYVELSRKLAGFQNTTGGSYYFQQLVNDYPEIEFEKIIKNLVGPREGSWESLQPRIITLGYHLFTDKFDNLTTVLKNTDMRVLSNMFVFKYIEQIFHPLVFRKPTDKVDVCVDTAISALPRAALRVYVRNHLNKENLKLATEMMDKIKLTYYEVIAESEWLSEDLKRHATEKVRSMKTMIGYPEEYEAEGALDSKFEALKYSPTDSFYTMMRKVERFRTEGIIEFASSDSGMNPLEPLVVANAFYFPMTNFMNILVPFLVHPIFDSTFPRYATMSGIGRVLAHEIGHAFDVSAVYTDHIGDKGYWFQANMSEEYDRRANCLKRQYDKIVEPKDRIESNNSAVMCEVIADALGTQVQWRTYKKMNMTGELRLHGFEQEPFDKLFFYLGALDFCSPKDTKQYTPASPMTHPPNRYRVNGVFANMKGFAETFNCPVGSPMNPTKRCQFF